MSDISSKGLKLFKVYQKLPILQRRVLQIRALIFDLNQKTEFVKFLLQADLKMQDGTRLIKNDFYIIFETLIAKGFLEANGNINPLAWHHIAVWALNPKNPDVKTNVALMQKLFGHVKPPDMRQAVSWQHYQTVHYAIYANDVTLFMHYKSQTVQYSGFILELVSRLFYIDGTDIEWVTSRHPLIQKFLCLARLRVFYGDVAIFGHDVKALATYYRSLAVKGHSKDVAPDIYSKLLQLDLCMGLAPSLPQGVQYFYHKEVLGAWAFLSGNVAKALVHYADAIKKFHVFFDRRQWLINNIHFYLYVLALLARNDFAKIYKVVNELREINYREWLVSLFNALASIKKNDIKEARHYYTLVSLAIEKKETAAEFFRALCAWLQCLLEPERIQTQLADYKQRFLTCLEISHLLAAHLYAELAIADPECAAFLAKSPFGSFRFLNIIRIKPLWEYSVAQLQNVVLKQDALMNVFVGDKRLVWLLDPTDLTIEVAEQKLRQDGKWTDGKLITLKRLMAPGADFNYLSKHDFEALESLRQENSGWYGQVAYYFDPYETVKKLIGHPLVFLLNNRSINLELVKGEMELQVEKRTQGYHVSLEHYSDKPHVILKKEAINRYRVIDFSADFVMVAKIISKEGLTVPLEAKDKILDMIGNAKSGIRINTDLDEDNLPVLQGDTSCCVNLLQMDEGMLLNLWMKPFGENGCYYRAAEGQKRLIVDVTTATGVQVRHKLLRDFVKEQESVNNLVRSCPTLAKLEAHNYDWNLQSMETCLEVLLELEAYKKHHPLTIEWPKGQALKLKREISFHNIALAIKGKNDWFEYDGEVTVDQGLVLNMQSLLELLDNNGHGRFVKLADGEFIALTEKLKKYLEELKTISEDNKVYRLGTGVLQSLAEEVNTESDQAWQEHITKLQSMQKYSPVIPKTLKANLREYQAVGFRYLSRLAHWGFGACLADDMGVGKTLQAITLLLELAPLGPTLVVAPTSVCFVWIEELAKFAPKLRAHMLGAADERQALVSALGKLDVLVCSYHLLIQASEMLIAKEWQVVILDEAQAIKNHYTKRWQSVMKLQTKCRIALTGTPIENHLGELWSIFRFLNPGLLGCLTSFQNRYSTPIEKHNDPVAKRALKNLVCPYILRRTKNQVLQELPPKTEQAILIEPSSDEMAFYEAVRIQALQRVQQLAVKGASKRFSILVEIMRLRQACCHSSLVDENINLESSKVKTFLTLVRNLLENDHKALVFSQYVRYLDKIKAVLDKENITYQYLDGATPVKARRQAVAAFQHGAGSLFLISLKAGGTGLNLTAADYVIILDPWWNPAVENQASDRAHRIGQERPVTVYRLIMKNSIEEKIVKLHKDKQDLADDLLSGSDVSGKITEEELMRLIER